ncbi:citramalate synthase [Propionibacteriaceae bacterium Y1923]|uniref:citramalate synthase n=1 Tax=Aestuariimicrobium sp. Y1814 TaxID=3418742 RepID=UPI003C1596DC
MTTSPVAPERVHIYDTTLRDGAQQEGLRLSVADKLRIAGLLDELGVSHIEGGWPGANPNDTAFFEAATRQLNLRNAQLVAFGATRKAGVKAADDPQVAGLRDAGTELICLVAKSHDRHVEQALRTTLDENLAMVSDTVTHLVSEGKRVFVDCEHFFDGFLENRTYALEVLRTAAEAGAEVVVLCDTNGGMLPSRMGDIVSAATAIGVDLGIHCHNDTGCAVANSMAALEAGAMHVQGTINGYGERTGNADLTTVVANLQLKYGWDVLGGRGLESLTKISHAISDITNQSPQARQPYVGRSSFAHKAGLHASAIRVDANLYQHIDPDLVGNRMRMLISDMSGRANVLIKAEELGVELTDREAASRVADTVKQREADGYSYESADASFELLLRDELGTLDKPFIVDTWTVSTTHAADGEGDSVATIHLGDKTYEHTGNGALNALDAALREALVEEHPAVEHYNLVDYAVRIVEQGHGTDSIVRVLIDTVNEDETWTTVGVGTNVVEASWEALSDAYLYGLVKHYA